MFDYITNLFKKKSTMEELKEVIEDDDQTQPDGGTEIIKNILTAVKLNGTDVVIPKVSVVCANVDMDYDETMQLIHSAPKSRYPVYEKEKDNIIGYLHIKAVLTFPEKNKKHFDIQKLVKPAIYVPESMPVLELYKEMRDNNLHIAVVIDEYGAFDGIITITDLLTKIIGEFDDDAQINDIQILNDSSIICHGATKLQKIDELWGLNLDETHDDDIITLGGYIFAMNGALPRKKTTILDEKNAVNLTILEVDDRRILKVQIDKISTR